MARVLILGGAGFVGFHLARRLAAEPAHRVTLVDDLSRGRADADLEALLAQPSVTLVRADLTDARALDASPGPWDQVFHLAAVVGVRNVARDPARAIRVNTLATLNVLESAAAAGGVLFFASTSEVYAGGMALGGLPVPTPEDVPLALEDIRNPRLAYAASKILGEAAVLHYAAARGLRVVIGRLHNVYGPRMGADHVVPEMALRALAGEDPFRVWGADQRRAFCHVEDAVEAILRLTATERAWGQIVNVGNDAEETLIEDLARLVLRVAGVTARLMPLPAPPGSVPRRCPDLGKLRALTGYVPKVSLEAGVRETVAWYRDRWAGGPA